MSTITDPEATPAAVPEGATGTGPASTEAADGLDWERLAEITKRAVAGLPGVRAQAVLDRLRRDIYPGIGADELTLAHVMAARTLIERHPDYGRVAARLLLHKLTLEATGYLHDQPGTDQTGPGQPDLDQAGTNPYPATFERYLRRAVRLGLVDPRLLAFDLDRIVAALRPERDLAFGYLGLQTLYDRYLLHHDGTRFELPQAFFMRVAMGLALHESEPERRAIEFYDLLSSFRFMASTPTLFNSGSTRPQLSSCFLTTLEDDLDSIFGSYRRNALLAKYSGGLGNDWTPVRGLGARIAGTNGESAGVVPFLKIANDTTVAVNQGGKRKGAACAYLETWHLDIEEFLELRKNTGDDRRRTHDMNTANWVPDEFIRRVEADESWTLFSPDEVPDLHELYGNEFAERYREYERAAERGDIRVFRTVRALDLWRRMLSMLFETGHPWITFKDACNLRSPQQHAGVVHSSNLCTEITLNTDADEVAVCNLGSVNLVEHIRDGELDVDLLAGTVRTAVRMLDNVIDINFYTVPEARRSNLRHRPVGLGLMGFADALFRLRIPLADERAVRLADRWMERISFHAIEASSALAEERGSYRSFPGSLWSKGILPIDSLRLLAEARNAEDLVVDADRTLDWEGLREHVRSKGMRNSNVMAIAPTATISNICGVSPSIEPLFRNLYVKSNMSGDFTVVNPSLVEDLERLGLWDERMVTDLKLHDGSLAPIDRVPDDLKALYATAFEIEPRWLVDAAAARQKWIDQAQSLNLYVARPSGRELDELYRYAWRKGLKTTYYLRALSATHVEKSTLRGTDGRLNAVAAQPGPTPAPARVPAPAPVPAPAAEPAATGGQPDAAVCAIDDPECEACQ